MGVKAKVDVAIAVVAGLGFGVTDENAVGMLSCPPQAVRSIKNTAESKKSFFIGLFCKEPANYCFYGPPKLVGRVGNPP